MLTTKEIDALRFYQGDVRLRTEDGQLSQTEVNKGFWGIKHAYRTMNCLMYDGIDNENERLKEMSGSLKPELFLEIDTVIEVFYDIYRAMCKSVANTGDAKSKYVYRTERGISIQELKKGYTISFTSTSKENKPEKFLQQKIDLTLLEIVFAAEIPHLDFEEILGDDNYYKNQKEVLLPPFLKIELKELELSQTELQFRDANGHPPCAKYLVLVKNMSFSDAELGNHEEQPPTVEQTKKAVNILDKLVEGEQLTVEEIKCYCGWKKDVRSIIRTNFQKIYSEYFPKKELTRKELLIKDVKDMTEMFDNRRKKYKKRLNWYNLTLIITNTIPLACMALSFLDSIQDIMKIAAVITSTLSILLSQLLKAEVLSLKILQRSKTYLQLCDLKREMKYENQWNPEKEDEYVKKYREIMKEDTEMSLQNIKQQAENTEKLYQNEIKPI